MTATIEELRETARKAEDAIYEIERAKRRDINGKKVGKTFKTHSNYSCPKKVSDYWWVYGRDQTDRPLRPDQDCR